MQTKKNSIIGYLEVLGDLFLLSVLWVVCSLPVLTLVPASIALYDSVSRCVLGELGGTYKRFFSTLVHELLRGCLVSLLWGALIFLPFVLYLLHIEELVGGWLGLIFFCISALLAFGTFCWLIALESRFYYGFWMLHRAAVSFAVLHCLRSLGLILLTFATVIACLYVPALILLAPGVLCAVQTRLIEPLFARYIAEKEEH